MVKEHLLHCFLSSVASLSFTKFISVLLCISSIHFILGRPLFLFPSPHANIISFSNLFDLMNPCFLPYAVCCSISSFSTSVFSCTASFLFLSIHDILCIFLHIHISHALIF